MVIIILTGSSGKRCWNFAYVRLAIGYDTTESLRVVGDTLIAVSCPDGSGYTAVKKWSLNEDHDPERSYIDSERVLPVKNASNHVAVVGK